MERHERELKIRPTQASRATIFGDWPRVLEALCSEGRDCDAMAADLKAISCVDVSPTTLGAMLRKLGWTTERKRRGDERVRVLVKETKCTTE